MSDTNNITDQQENNDNFQRAVNRQDYNEMESLLQKGADINVQNVRGVTPLYAAILAKNNKMIDWLLGHGASPNLKNSLGDNAMIEVANRDDNVLLEKLIRAGGDVNLSNKLGVTPLIEACQAGRFENAQSLIDAKADLNARTSQGATALLNAAQAHDYNTVEMLLKAGANPNDKDTTYGVTALISASSGKSIDDEEAKMKSLKTVQVLLKHKADPNIAANSGNTPMAAATLTLNRSVLMELMHYGANPNVKTTAGVNGVLSPLMMACAQHDVELVEALIKAKADPFFSNDSGQDAMYMNIASKIDDKKEKGVVLKILDILTSTGVTVDFKKKSLGMAHFGLIINEPGLIDKAASLGGINQQDEVGRTPMHLAIAMGKNKEIKHLLDLGADLKLKDEEGRYPLHILATGQGSPKLIAKIKQMLQHPDPEQKEKGDKLLKEYKELIFTTTKDFLDKGAELEAQDKKGNSALMLACFAYAGKQVERRYLDFLVEQGASITLENENGDTAFSLAIKMGDDKLVEDWSKKLIAEGQEDVIKNIIMDISWGAPESPEAIARVGEIFKKLIELGASVHVTDEDGQTPLIVASATNQEELVKLLLDLGADPNHKNNEGEVAVVQAIANNNPNISKILFERGAVDNVYTKDNEDLLAIAYRYQNTPIINQINDEARKRREREQDAADAIELAQMEEKRAAAGMKKGPF